VYSKITAYLPALDFVKNKMYNYCMITGHGIDIVALDRFYKMTHKRLDRLAQRILTNEELDVYVDLINEKQPLYLAKIWASKEAISKAFGTGIRGDITWKNIRILNDSLGKPKVWVKVPGVYCLLSISHEKEYLIASAMIGVINAL
jgi:holo-[acyl-carrier protein] synthase